MAKENELQTLREELKKIEEQTRRSRKRAAFGFVILLVVTIVSIGYGLIQRAEAVRQAEQATRQHTLAEMSEKQAKVNLQEALRQEALAMEQRRLAEEKVQELEKCCKKR